MGCLRKVGCAFIILLFVAVAWFTREFWMSFLPGRRAKAGAAVATWETTGPAGADRASRALQTLETMAGTAYTTVTPADLISLMLSRLGLPESVDSLQAGVAGDRIYVRALINTADLGGKETFGPFAKLMGERERLQMSGTIRVIQPGLSEFQVKEIRIRDVAIPSLIIPKLVEQLGGSERTSEVSKDGMPFKTPSYIGDVRVANGKITIYRTTGTKS